MTCERKYDPCYPENSFTFYSIEEESNIDKSDNKGNVNKIVLKVGDSFNNWESIQIVIDSYVKQNSFMSNKCRKDLDQIDKSII